MNEHPDPIEELLASLHPQPPSPHMRQWLALTGGGHSTAQQARRARWWLVAAAFLVAASAGWLVLGHPRHVESPRQPPGVVATIQAKTHITPKEDIAELPTVEAYSRALAESPAALDRLLERDAARFGPTDTPRPMAWQLN